MPVHLLGKPADMTSILKIAKKYKLKVIEDSCETMFVEGIGQGDVTCFSFYVAHLLVTGVGGMACTNDRELAELIRSLIFHGRDTKYLQISDDDKYDQEVIDARFRFNYPGHSYRGTEMEAALGLVELANHKVMLKKRKKNATYLNTYLGQFSKEYMDNHAFMMFPYLSLFRNKLMSYLEKHGITTRTLMPLVNQPYIKVDITKYPMAQQIGNTGLLIGCHQDLTGSELQYMVRKIKEFEHDRS